MTGRVVSIQCRLGYWPTVLVCEHDGESEVKPCAEALLTEDAAERILESGLMPLVTLTGRDAVRVVRFQSIANPPSTLVGL